MEGMNIRGDVLQNYKGSDKEVTIPGEVIEISYNAFMRCAGLTRVVIPEGVEKIDSWAFRNCNDLISITIPDSMKVIETNAFDDCPSLTKLEISPNNRRFRFENGLLLGQNGKQLKCCVGGFTGVCQIPDGVRQISPFAFACCRKVTEIILSDSVEAIGTNAFEDCTALERLQIPQNVKRLGTRACANCTNLKEIVIPEGITSISTDAFNSCTALSVVKLPQTLEQIGAYAFKQCTSLREIALPPNLKVIKKHAFEGAKLEQLEIPKSLIEIEVMAFADTMLTELVIPETLETVGLYNFRGCPLRKVTLIGNHTKLIAGSLGEGNFSLIADQIPLTDIHQSYKGNAILTFANRFSEGEDLSEAQKTEYMEYIKKQRKRLYPLALKNPVLLQLMADQKFIPQADLNELLEEAAKQGQTEASAMLLEYQNKAFGYIDQDAAFEKELKRQMRILETGELPVGEAKKSWRFEVKEDDTIRITGYKGKETRVLVPEKIGKRGVTEIGKEAFSAVMPHLLTSIKEVRAKLEAVIIPEGITTIGELAFSQCVALAELSIPASVTSMKKNAISGCRSLCGLTINPDNRNYTTNGTDLCQEKGTVLLACPGAEGDYHIRETVKKIAAGAFAFASKLTSVTIPEGVEVIEPDTFQECSSLCHVFFSSGLKKICGRAFWNCGSLAKIEIPEGGTTIETDAFSRCYALTDIKLPASVKEIGRNAFPPTFYYNTPRRTIYAPARSAAARYAVKYKYYLVSEKE